jgi:chromosome segregation ATPase
LQGSLNKITNERDQLIERRDDLQCKLARQAEKIVKLEYKMKKNLTNGTPEVTSVPEPKRWLSPPKRKTQPQIQAKPRYEKRLEDGYAARGSELVRTTDAQIKSAQERVTVAEEQLRQAQERIVAFEEQAQQVKDHAEGVVSLKETCRVQADDCKASHEQWGQFHDNQMEIETDS